MSSSVPCLGFASRTAAVAALRADGLATAAIAARIGITPKQVNGLEASYRKTPRRKIGTACRSGQVSREVERLAGTSPAIFELFPYHQRLLFRAHAVRRDVSCAQLIQMIVEKVIADDIVDAVLDDAGDIGRWV